MRVAVVAGPDPGHALPAIGVAGALVRRGHTVAIYTGQEHAQTARAHGVTPYALPTIERAAPPPQGFGERLADVAVGLTEPLVRAWHRDPPDVVVVDTLVRGGGFAAQLCDRPWVELIGHHLPDPDLSLPPVGLGRPYPRTPWRRADDRRLVTRQRRSVAQGSCEHRQAAAAVGLSEPAAPVVRLVATVPSLERPRSVWPGNAHVVGALAVDPVGAPLPPPDGTAPLVVVTDSTATGVGGTLGALAVTALHGCDLRVVVTSGDLPARRGPAVVVGEGPHGPLLAAADVAVCHGGGGFLSKAAAAGVPTVIVPRQGDQREAAARWRDVGAGRVLRGGRLSGRRLRWAVARLLVDQDAAAAAGRLAAEASQLGRDCAAWLVEAAASGAAPRATGRGHHLDVPSAPAAEPVSSC